MRQRIKETIWDKQNQREGFSETFKPLISQFEKPEDPKKKNIFTQNQEMLQNQSASASASACEGLPDKLILSSCFLPNKNVDPAFICQALYSLKSPISVLNVSFSFTMILQPVFMNQN